MAFNPVQSFQQGMLAGQSILDSQRANRLNELREALSGQMSQVGFDPSQSADFQRLAALDPSGGARMLSVYNALDENRKKAIYQDAREGVRMLEAGDIEGFSNFTNNRIENIQRLGGDPSGTMEVKAMIDSGDFQGALDHLKRVERIGVGEGFLRSTEPDELEQLKLEKARLELDRMKSGAPSPSDLQVGATVRGRDAQGNPRIGQMVFDKGTRKARVEWADGGEIQIDKLSDLEKSELKIAEAKQKADIAATQKAQEVLKKRREELRLNILKSGREATKGINDLDRIERAIDAYGTGKMEQFKKLVGPYIPGIDPSDPQAMTALLNKGVFPVLAGFSGAISEGERAFAAETVANLGNTPEANRIIIRHMRRSIQDEIDKRDQFNRFAEDRNDYENFEFTPVDFVPQQTVQPAQPTQVLSDEDLLRKYGGL